MNTNTNGERIALKTFEGIAHKGEIWNIEPGDTTCTGSEIWAGRPAVIVSNEATCQKAGFVNVVYLTTAKKRDMPYHIPVCSGGKNATALCEQIFAVDKSRISYYVGKVTEEEMLGIDKALLFSLGISNSIRPSSLFTKWLNAVTRYHVDLSKNPLDDAGTDHRSVPELIKERDKYKMLWEQERSTVNKLMQI